MLASPQPGHSKYEAFTSTDLVSRKPPQTAQSSRNRNKKWNEIEDNGRYQQQHSSVFTSQRQVPKPDLSVMVVGDYDE